MAVWGGRLRQHIWKNDHEGIYYWTTLTIKLPSSHFLGGPQFWIFPNSVLPKFLHRLYYFKLGSSASWGIFRTYNFTFKPILPLHVVGWSLAADPAFWGSARLQQGMARSYLTLAVPQPARLIQLPACHTLGMEASPFATCGVWALPLS